MALFGRLLALAWMDTLGGDNPFGVIAFSLLATLLFYLPATNRMLQDGEGVIAFYLWTFVWLYSRKPRRAQALQPIPALAP
jgi:hypothetical protein